jgi:hypothetical protein
LATARYSTRHRLKCPPGDVSPLRREARRASDAEKAALWPKLVAMYRDYDDYKARTTRNIPVMILS